MSRISVVHLVRAVNGPDPLARFLNSYSRTNKLAGQELAIIFKGFENNPHELSVCQKLLAEHPHQALMFPDIGFDIKPYFHAARSLNAEYVCFLNSFSEILDADWLEKMLRALQLPGIGIVGATSSCLSYQNYYEEHKEEFLQKPLYNSPHGRIRFALVQKMYKRWYAPFPNPFIRTNGFLLRRDVFLRVPPPNIRGKTSAYRFESGTSGMTRRIQRMGLRPLVMGRNGIAYEIADWPQSLTFMQGNQENLLIADNQTTYYQTAEDSLRQEISYSSWGPDAAPAVGANRIAINPAGSNPEKTDQKTGQKTDEKLTVQNVVENTQEAVQ